MKAENQDALLEVDEYYPTTVSTGISQIENDQEVGNSAIKSITYYALNGTKLSTPNKGVNIRKIELANGTIKTDKVIK